MRAQLGDGGRAERVAESGKTSFRDEIMCVLESMWHLTEKRIESRETRECEAVSLVRDLCGL